MRGRVLIGLCAGILVAIAAAVAAAYVYDRSRRDTIAAGVRVDRIDIGGLKRAAAEAKLERELVAPLQRPVIVSYHRKRFTLTPRAAHVRVDVGALADEALHTSRDRSFLVRVSRDLTGGGVHIRLTPDVRYDRRALGAFVARVANGVNRRPRDAHLTFTGRSVRAAPGRNGARVDLIELERATVGALVSAGGSRAIMAPVRRTRPRVTRALLAARDPSIITVDRGAFRLTLWRHLKRVKTYPIAVGQVGLDTPAGLYRIQNKAVNPSWSVPHSAWAGSLAGQVIPPGPENPLKARWMAIFDGAGIHGTDDLASIGSAASHGCIRMSVPDVIDLYDRVAVGTPVYVA